MAARPHYNKSFFYFLNDKFIATIPNWMLSICMAFVGFVNQCPGSYFKLCVPRPDQLSSFLLQGLIGFLGGYFILGIAYICARLGILTKE